MPNTMACCTTCYFYDFFVAYSVTVVIIIVVVVAAAVVDVAVVGDVTLFCLQYVVLSAAIMNNYKYTFFVIFLNCE